MTVGVDQIIEIGLAGGLAERILVRAHVDGREPLLAVRIDNDPQVRIGRRLSGRDRVDLAAQALIVDLAHDSRVSGRREDDRRARFCPPTVAMRLALAAVLRC
jgi:hypothetical protein